jgi:hypothetical protein
MHLIEFRSQVVKKNVDRYRQNLFCILFRLPMRIENRAYREI